MSTMTKKKKTKKEKLPTDIGENETVVEFDEQFKWPGTNKRLTFDGPKFQQWIYETLPMTRDMKPISPQDAVKEGEQIDDFVFYMRPLPMWRWGSRWEGLVPFMLPDTKLVPMRCALEIYRGTQAAYCAFSTEINIPVLAKPDRFSPRRLEPWMSLTPNEILTQRGQVRRAKKDVGLAGLGLGWAARKILQRKQVKHLTIYEKCNGIMQYFGEPLAQEFPDKVTLINEDAYDINWHQHDVAIWDIWESYGGASWDRKFQQIKADMEKDSRVCVGWGQGVTGG